jgi:translocation and assembly module TamA
VDLRDNPTDPRSGAYFSVRGQAGGELAGGAFQFAQLTPDLRGYVSLGTPRLVFAARVRLGALLGDGPVTERYFSGGPQSHRGFSERRLSPVQARNGEKVPIGGRALVETSGELRLQLGKMWALPYWVTLFLDGGNVWNDEYAADLGDLHWAAGAGLALQAAGVKIRLDVGHRLNLKGRDQPEYRRNTAILLGIGDSF